MKLEKQGRELWLTREEIAHIIEVIRMISDLDSAICANQLDGLYLYDEPITVDQLDLMVEKLELLCGFYGRELS